MIAHVIVTGRAESSFDKCCVLAISSECGPSEMWVFYWITMIAVAHQPRGVALPTTTRTQLRPVCHYFGSGTN
jgi:hypothetical protein